jgi:hypothetical protein
MQPEPAAVMACGVGMPAWHTGDFYPQCESPNSTCRRGGGNFNTRPCCQTPVVMHANRTPTHTQLCSHFHTAPTASVAPHTSKYTISRTQVKMPTCRHSGSCRSPAANTPGMLVATPWLTWGGGREALEREGGCCVCSRRLRPVMRIVDGSKPGTIAAE